MLATLATAMLIKFGGHALSMLAGSIQGHLSQAGGTVAQTTMDPRGSTAYAEAMRDTVASSAFLYKVNPREHALSLYNQRHRNIASGLAGGPDDYFNWGLQSSYVGMKTAERDFGYWTRANEIWTPGGIVTLDKLSGAVAKAQINGLDAKTSASFLKQASAEDIYQRVMSSLNSLGTNQSSITNFTKATAFKQIDAKTWGYAMSYAVQKTIKDGKAEEIVNLYKALKELRAQGYITGDMLKWAPVVGDFLGAGGKIEAQAGGGKLDTAAVKSNFSEFTDLLNKHQAIESGEIKKLIEESLSRQDSQQFVRNLAHSISDQESASHIEKAIETYNKADTISVDLVPKMVDNLANRYMRDYNLSKEQAVVAAIAVLNNLAIGTKSKEQMAQDLKGFGIKDEVAQKIAAESTNRENLTTYFEDAARDAGFLGKKVEEKTAQTQQKVAGTQAEIEKQMEKEDIKQLELMYSEAIKIMDKINKEKVDLADVQAQIDKIKAEYNDLYNKYKPKIEKLRSTALDNPKDSVFIRRLEDVGEFINRTGQALQEIKQKLGPNDSPTITKDGTPAGP